METTVMGYRGVQGWGIKGPSTQYLGTWDLGNNNYGIGFGVSI